MKRLKNGISALHNFVIDHCKIIILIMLIGSIFLCILTRTVIYRWVPKEIPITLIGPEYKDTGVLTENSSVELKFTAKAERLFMVTFLTGNQTKIGRNEKIVIALFKDGQELTRQETTLQEMPSQGFVQLGFDLIEKSMGEEYVLKIFPKSSKSEMEWRLACSDEKNKFVETYIDGKSEKNIVANAYYQQKEYSGFWYSLLIFALVLTVSSLLFYSGKRE